MSRRTKIILLGTVIAVVFVPFPTPISKETAIRFVRSPDVSVSGLRVYQSWECFGGLSGRGQDEGTTDERGAVRFPARFAYGSVVSRILGRLVGAIAVHASYGSQVRVEFTLNAPSKAIFSPPLFKKLDPFILSGSYLDSVGRHYFSHIDGMKQRVSITGDFCHETDGITINIE